VQTGAEMTVTAGFMVPHPPLIVPEIGKGEERGIRETTEAYEKAAGEIAVLKPETIVVISPHTVMYADYFHVSPGKEAEGDFRQFRAGQVRFKAEYDEEFVRCLCRNADASDFPMGIMGEREKKLDHGVMVPLYFINKYLKEYRLVRIGLSGLSKADHYRAGMLIEKTANQLGRCTVVVASGDLSHRLKEDGPYGYREEGPAYDQRIMETMGKAAFGELLDYPESLCEKAGECGHRSFTMMAGCLDGKAVNTEKLSYQGPFGVGYGICTFHVTGRDEKRRFLEQYMREQQQDMQARKEKEDCYVRLARKSLETFVRTGRKASLTPEEKETLPREMTESRAGVFVSIHKDGMLRGCIGTIAPVAGCVAEEILRNAVSSGTEDPRFPPVEKEELDTLVYSVDVLGAPEPVSSPGELDVKKYGVIVTKGRKRGLLLPDLEGVDTVEEQIAIARRKAGIGEEDTVTLERFEVIRHGEKG